MAQQSRPEDDKSLSDGATVHATRRHVSYKWGNNPENKPLRALFMVAQYWPQNNTRFAVSAAVQDTPRQVA
jgi:hypothetical protein